MLWKEGSAHCLYNLLFFLHRYTSDLVVSFLQCSRYSNSLGAGATWLHSTPDRYITKGHPMRGHESPQGSRRISLLSLTSAINRGGWSTPRSGRFTPAERPGTHCTVDWVGPRAGLDGCGVCRPHRDSIPRPCSPQRVAIPTELTWLTTTKPTTNIS
jgi:hypothetical protein